MEVLGISGSLGLGGNTELLLKEGRHDGAKVAVYPSADIMYFRA
jgi:hypothetical protein|tara:strand:+ start:405 stop:536 length:132 start_codon:yes stop_codon:yes gene_type:complete